MDAGSSKKKLAIAVAIAAGVIATSSITTRLSAPSTPQPTIIKQVEVDRTTRVIVSSRVESLMFGDLEMPPGTKCTTAGSASAECDLATGNHVLCSRDGNGGWGCRPPPAVTPSISTLRLPSPMPRVSP